MSDPMVETRERPLSLSYRRPADRSERAVLELDGESETPQVECPPDNHFAGSCTDGCNTWTCDGSGTCSVTSLYCPKDGLWITP